MFNNYRELINSIVNNMSNSNLIAFSDKSAGWQTHGYIEIRNHEKLWDFNIMKVNNDEISFIIRDIKNYLKKIKGKIFLLGKNDKVVKKLKTILINRNIPFVDLTGKLKIERNDI